jgi:large subunit ribosomal protein L9e
LTHCLHFTGKLVKDLSHLAVCFSLPNKNTVNIEIHHGNRKNVATLRTVKSIIQNLITGVTKGYKYKMRYVYAHFPINVNIEKNNETGLFEVEIRYDTAPGVTAEEDILLVYGFVC